MLYLLRSKITYETTYAPDTIFIAAQLQQIDAMEWQGDIILQPRTTKLGSLNLTDHSKKRMADRGIKETDVLAAAHGHRYIQDNGTLLCVYLKHKVAIILAKDSKTVITVLTGMTKNKLSKRLEKRVCTHGKKAVAQDTTKDSYPTRAPEVDEFDAFRID